MIAFVLALLVSLAVNLYIIVFGKQDLEALKTKISVKQYLEEMEDALDDSIGDRNTTILKLALIALFVVVVIVNAFLCLYVILGVVVGTFLAKKSWGIPSVHNLLNKIATYINRIR